MQERRLWSKVFMCFQSFLGEEFSSTVERWINSWWTISLIEWQLYIQSFISIGDLLLFHHQLKYAPRKNIYLFSRWQHATASIKVFLAPLAAKLWDQNFEFWSSCVFSWTIFQNIFLVLAAIQYWFLNVLPFIVGKTDSQAAGTIQPVNNELWWEWSHALHGLNHSGLSFPAAVGFITLLPPLLHPQNEKSISNYG